MSHSWRSRARSLPSRRLHVRLRLKVMAGVVVVTLLALAAFDVGVVTTMRRYLLTQTDNNLQLALTVTEPRLNSLVSARFSVAPPPLSRYQRPTSKLPGFLGDFQIAFVPWRGPVVTLEMGQTGVGGTQWAYMPPSTARSAARPGPHTVPVGGAVPLPVGPGHGRLAGRRHQPRPGHRDHRPGRGHRHPRFDRGGAVHRLGVFVVVRRGLRPVEAMARAADRITGGDLTGRVATHNPRSEVGRLGAALNGMLARIEASQQQMRRFFADASHELRTPLASLRANAQLYQQGALQDPGEVDEVMGRIVLETRRMGRS